MTDVYINRIATAVPPHDIHSLFVNYADSMLSNLMKKKLFKRMADRAHISHRYSILASDAAPFYVRGQFPSTVDRMRLFQQHAPSLVTQAVDMLFLRHDIPRITHIIITSCTGFYAPGIDLELIKHYQFSSSVERTIVGFMGCYAAMNALKLARHIVRSDANARVLIVNIELCSLHLQEADDIEQLLSFLLFSDGCAASLVSADPEGLMLEQFHSAVIPKTDSLITWNIGDLGFDMFLSGEVPRAIKDTIGNILNCYDRQAICHWAVHPGGRTILDAVEEGLGLQTDALAQSRDVLKHFGNMSSATIMFVLKSMLPFMKSGEHGCAISFGPGVTAETLLFKAA